MTMKYLFQLGLVALLCGVAMSFVVDEERVLKKYGKSYGKYGKSSKGKGGGKGKGKGGSSFPSSNLQECAFANPVLTSVEW